MHLLHLFLFMLNLAQATPVPTEDSSAETYFKFPDDDSVPVIDDLTFNFGDESPEAQKKHEKRSPVPPFYLDYKGWQVSFQRSLGDRYDFKKDFWIYMFPGVYDFKTPSNPPPVDIVIAPGRGRPVPLTSSGSSNGDLWYSSNSYFGPLLDMGAAAANANRTYTEYCLATQTVSGWQFWIRRGLDPASSPTKNKHALFNINGRTSLPTSGYISLDFKNTTVNGSVYFNSDPPLALSYRANITGKLAKQGKMWV